MRFNFNLSRSANCQGGCASAVADVIPMHGISRPNSGGGDARNKIAERGTELAKFLKMDGRKAFDHLFAVAGETQLHTPAIRWRRSAAEQLAPHQPVDQTDGAVMTNLQVISEFSNKRVVPSRKPFQDEQRLMLLYGESGAAGRLFAEVQENPQGVSDGGQ